MADAILTVNGTEYGGWKQIDITRSIETIAGTFELLLSEHNPAKQHLAGIKPGDKCSVALDGDTVITGHVDVVAPSYDASAHEVSVTGRDATGDLVDCSIFDEPVQYTGVRLEQIVEDIARPFGIEVYKATDTGKPFDGVSFHIEDSETAFEAIERACRMRGVLATSDAHGGLILTRAGANYTTTRLERGQNILRADAEFNHKDRFGQYIVKGQQPSRDELEPTDASHVVRKVEDPAIGRYRPMVFLGETAIDEDTGRDRVTWQANLRASRSRRVNITVQGWRETPGGSLWRPNTVAPVKDDWLGINQDLLIAGCNYHKGDDGTTATLYMVPVGAFQLEPPAEPEEDAGWIS